MQPLFVNLAALQPQVLDRLGGSFGWVLRLVQQRRIRLGEFRRLLVRVVRHLEAMPRAERLRWLDLLSYIHAMVYHERSAAEQASLREAIEASVQTDDHRQEVFNMGKSMADLLKDEGRKEGREKGREEGRKEGQRKGREEGRLQGRVEAARSTLMRQLRKRFGELPKKVSEHIEATTDLEQLNVWLDRVVTAATLQDVQIDSKG